MGLAKGAWRWLGAALGAPALKGRQGRWAERDLLSSVQFSSVQFSSVQFSSLAAALALTGACADAPDEPGVATGRHHSALAEQAAGQEEAPPEQEAYTDCGGEPLPRLLWLSLLRWPLADEAPPAISRGEALSLSVRNDIDLDGSLVIHGRAASQRGASSAVLFRGELAAREEIEVEVLLDDLALPERELDLLGQLAFTAVFTTGDVRSVSDDLTVYFRPVDGGVELFDETARAAQAPDGATTDAGRSIAASAAAVSDELVQRGEAVPSPEGLTVGFAFRVEPAPEEATDPDDRIFDDQGGRR